MGSKEWGTVPSTNVHTSAVVQVGRFKTFAAKYPGTCVRCGERFAVGDPIYYNDNDELVAHLGKCEEKQPDPDLTMTVEEVRAARCPRCFLIHKGDCL